METLLGILLVGGGVVALLIAATFIRSFVLTKLWLWFAVPIFHLQPITYAQAMGISILISMLTAQYIKNNKGEEEGIGILAYTFIGPLISLAIGYIVSFYI